MHQVSQMSSLIKETFVIANSIPVPVRGLLSSSQPVPVAAQSEA
jgi:hypothetical protein